jgi:hypothetical protein
VECDGAVMFTANSYYLVIQKGVQLCQQHQKLIRMRQVSDKYQPHLVAKLHEQRYREEIVC